jgi:uncharacterized protein
VLFSAAYRSDAGLLRLWRLPRVQLIASGYAVAEARANLGDAEQRDRLAKLLESVETVPEAVDRSLPPGVDVPAKDRPILQAAIAAKATHLITGDVTHFGEYFGRRIGGVGILAPGDYLRRTERE